jgi:hypothetical protein
MTELTPEESLELARIWQKFYGDLVGIPEDIVREGKALERHRIQEWVNELKANNGCAICGVTYGNLQYHHRSEKDKLFQLCDAYKYSEEEVEAELAKCDVLCQSCHGVAHMLMGYLEKFGLKAWAYVITTIAKEAE